MEGGGGGGEVWGRRMKDDGVQGWISSRVFMALLSCSSPSAVIPTTQRWNQGVSQWCGGNLLGASPCLNGRAHCAWNTCVVMLQGEHPVGCVITTIQWIRSKNLHWQWWLLIDLATAKNASVSLSLLIIVKLKLPSVEEVVRHIGAVFFQSIQRSFLELWVRNDQINPEWKCKCFCQLF